MFGKSLEENIRGLSDDELLNIYYDKKGEYSDEAYSIAVDELEKRDIIQKQSVTSISPSSGSTNPNSESILVTTCDLNCDYTIIGPVYFQVSNKGIFSSSLNKLINKYHNRIEQMKKNKTMSKDKFDWGFLIGEWSVGQNEFEQAFFVAVEELKLRASLIGADAIIGMRQDIDIDTNGFQFFYLQMYGTAVKYK